MCPAGNRKKPSRRASTDPEVRPEMGEVAGGGGGATYRLHQTGLGDILGSRV